MKQARILVIDDELIAQEAIEAFLVKDGYQVLFATNGVDGIKIAIEKCPDVVLLDLMMPGMDGFEVCQQLRAQPALAETPILMVTAHEDRDVRRRGLSVGADDFLTKPFDHLELRARLKIIVRLKQHSKPDTKNLKLKQDLKELKENHERLKQAYNETISAWSRAMDIRDKETEGHSQRVANIATALGRKMGLDEETITDLRHGALLHDVGKIGIPDQILHKPNKLTDEEWEIIRQHPTYAYQMLTPISHLKSALDIVYCHHEKWDGSGYPQGIKGEEIPITARIFTIAHVWDAMTSDRPYRPAWSETSTLQYILSQAGKHFDPEIVQVFKRMHANREIQAFNNQK